jgi:hypothetical protein
MFNGADADLSLLELEFGKGQASASATQTQKRHDYLHLRVYNTLYINALFMVVKLLKHRKFMQLVGCRRNQ